MTRFRTALVLLLALIWAPVTSHCMFERLPGFEFLSCCIHEETADPSHHEEQDCAADACAVVEEGFYKLQDDDVLVVGSAVINVLHYELQDQPTTLTASRPPPDLTVGWQFSSRAAPLPRAPSSLL